jgi:hypothetical protein
MKLAPLLSGRSLLATCLLAAAVDTGQAGKPEGMPKLPQIDPIANLHNCKFVFDLKQQKEVSLLNPIVIKEKRVEFSSGSYEYQGSFALLVRLGKEKFVDLGHKALIFCDPRSRDYKVVLVPRAVSFIKPHREGPEKVFDVYVRIDDDGLTLQVRDPKNNKLCAEISNQMLEMHKLAAAYDRHRDQEPVPLWVSSLKTVSSQVKMLIGQETYDLKTNADFKYLGCDLSMQGEGYRVFLFGHKSGELYAACAGPATEILVDGKCPPSTKFSIDESKGSPRVTVDKKVYSFKDLPLMKRK